MTTYLKNINTNEFVIKSDNLGNYYFSEDWIEKTEAEYLIENFANLKSEKILLLKLESDRRFKLLYPSFGFAEGAPQYISITNKRLEALENGSIYEMSVDELENVAFMAQLATDLDFFKTKELLIKANLEATTNFSELDAINIYDDLLWV